MSINITVPVRQGEPIDRALKRLKARVDKEGIIDDVRRKRAFENTAQILKRKAKKLTKSWKFMKMEARANRERNNH
jgi:small subunit ribosomal protein S21